MDSVIEVDRVKLSFQVVVESVYVSLVEYHQWLLLDQAQQ